VPTVQQVERKILEVEGFPVRILFNGRKANRNRRGLATYRYKNRFPGTRSASEWRRVRFWRSYPEYNVEVLASDGARATPVNGNWLLRRVRQEFGGA
jgi:hypothetical protein